MKLDALLDEAADFINTHDTLSIVGHSDADGISAVTILETTCDELGKAYTVQWIDQISTLALERLDKGEAMIFTDMGSSHLDEIGELFPDADILILDHHQPDGKTDFLFVNPELVGLDGTRDACTSTIAYEVAARLIDPKHLSVIALIGAQGDHQEPFEGYNSRILDECVEKRQVTMHKGAMLFGIQAKPLVPLIAYSYDLKITGVTGSQDGARRLLDELEIDGKYYTQLSEEDRKILDETLIRRSKNPHPEITHYVLEGMPRGPLRDTREAASLLNACGRLNRADLGVDVLRTRDPRKASSVQRQYRMAIRKGREFYEQGDHEEKDSIIVMNAEEEIPPSVAGALCSGLVRGGEVTDGTVVVCLARYGNGLTKVSSRVSGGTDLSVLMSKAAGSVEGEGGGHDCAAGAIIPTDREDDFIDAVFSLAQE